MDLRDIDHTNFDQVAEIYKQGIETGLATFQNDIPDWDSWDKSHLSNCRIAVFENNQMAGWGSLSPVSGRCVYAGVAEVSVYIAAGQRGKGVGSLLLNQLIDQSEKAGFWTLQSGIFSENIASVKLHEKCGFRQIGYREKIGRKNGIWKDNIIMERRSKIVGI
jgi:L-amino acid N-acyltransferase YncA